MPGYILKGQAIDLYGQPMVNVKAEGDMDLRSVADAFTIGGSAYGDAIIQYNGLDRGQYILPDGEVVGIPVSWLREEFKPLSVGVIGAPQVQPRQSAYTQAVSPPQSNLLLYVAGAVILAAVLMS